MKTYKEINEDIIVPEELKEKTLHQMKDRRIHHHIKLKLAGVCIIFIALGGMVAFYSLKQTNSPQKQEEKFVFKLEDYIHEYDVDEAKTGYNIARDIAGGIYNMNRKLLEKTVDEVPALYQLKYPNGYEVSMSLMEYRNDATFTGPYVVVWYCAEKGDQYIYAEISDKDMPRCFAAFSEEEEGWKTYKDYSIDITHRKTELGEGYWVSAKRKNYIIEVNAVVENSKDFEAFLESFLI